MPRAWSGRALAFALAAAVLPLAGAARADDCEQMCEVSLKACASVAHAARWVCFAGCRSSQDGRTAPSTEHGRASGASMNGRADRAGPEPRVDPSARAGQARPGGGDQVGTGGESEPPRVDGGHEEAATGGGSPPAGPDGGGDRARTDGEGDPAPTGGGEHAARADRAGPGGGAAGDACRPACRRRFAAARRACLDDRDACRSRCRRADRTDPCESACAASRADCLHALRRAGETRACRDQCEAALRGGRERCGADAPCRAAARARLPACLQVCASSVELARETCEGSYDSCAAACRGAPRD